MGGIVSTLQAAKTLGVSHSRLIRAVWDGRIDPPAKVPGGAFAWTEADINRASHVLLHRPYKAKGGAANAG
jgi:predicted DNA-binding transcriptional regulator AlpA